MFTSELKASPLLLFWLDHFTAVSNSTQLVTQQLLLSAAQTTPRTPGICPGLPNTLASEFQLSGSEISHHLWKQPHAHQQACDTSTSQAEVPLPPTLTTTMKSTQSIQPAHGPGRPSWGRWFHCYAWLFNHPFCPILPPTPPYVTPGHFSQDDRLLKWTLVRFQIWLGTRVGYRPSFALCHWFFTIIS